MLGFADPCSGDHSELKALQAGAGGETTAGSEDRRPEQLLPGKLGPRPLCTIQVGTHMALPKGRACAPTAPSPQDRPAWPCPETGPVELVKNLHKAFRVCHTAFPAMAVAHSRVAAGGQLPARRERARGFVFAWAW